MTSTHNYDLFTSNGGHSAKSPGACSGEYKEHEQTRLINQAFIKAMKERGYKVADTTSDAGNASAVLKEQAQAANAVSVGSKHLALSYHLNAGNGTGTEVLYWGEGTKGIAAELSAAIANTLGIKDRGPKQRKDLYFLRTVKSPALIIEVCFIDCASDMKKLEARRTAVAEAVADVLVGKPSSSKDSSTQSSTASTATATSSTASTTQTAYTGTSLVDYLKSLGGVDSSFANRAKLAVEYGVVSSASQYKGTAAQNTALLAAMRKAVSE